MGSSSTSRLPPSATSCTRLRRRRSPPESPSMVRSASSPLNRNRPSSLRASVSVSDVPALTVSTIVLVSTYSRACWLKYEGSTLCPMLTRPAAASRLPSRVSTVVVLPAPLGPTTATRCPRSMVNPAESTSTRFGTSTRRPSASMIMRPGRSVFGNPNDSDRSRVGTSMRSVRSSFFARDLACRARVPARHRVTNRSSRSISSLRFSACAASCASSSARARRNAEYPMGHRRAFSRDRSSTLVAVDSRNQRSCDTITTAAARSVMARSSHSMASRSRWLVGSSSSSTCGRPAMARARDARVSSPPDRLASGRSS